MQELAAYTIWVPTLLLVIFRVGGMFITAPLLSDASIPVRVKAAVSIVMALAVVGRLVSPAPMPSDWTTLVLGIGSEMLIGATIGYATTLLFQGVALGAQHIGQQMGIALANIYNPMAQTTSNVLSTLFNLTAVVIFLAIGGHRLMIQGLLETFHTVPLMGFTVDATVLGVIVALMTASFVLAAKVGAPVVVAMLLASMAMGLIQRTMPQFNILSAGFQIRVMAAAIILAVSVAALVPLVQAGWEMTMERVAEIFPAPAP